jgi:hypothetical protein
MTKCKRRPLDRAERRRIAWTLGLDTLPDLCAEGIVQLISVHHGALAFIKGHTVARAAATLRRVEDRMSRGHHDPETTREIVGIGKIVGINELVNGNIPSGLETALLAVAALDDDRTVVDNVKLGRWLRRSNEVVVDGLFLRHEGSDKGDQLWSLQTNEPEPAKSEPVNPAPEPAKPEPVNLASDPDKPPAPPPPFEMLGPSPPGQRCISCGVKRIKLTGQDGTVCLHVSCVEKYLAALADP